MCAESGNPDSRELRAVMRVFREQLDAVNPSPGSRRWIYVPYDQLNEGFGPLGREPASELGIVLIECPAKAARRPYHQQKLALVLANQRHFALEQARRGVAVRYEVNQTSYADALRDVAAEVGALRAQRPAERELRRELEPLVTEGLLEWLPHEGWLTTTEQFQASQKNADPPWRMDAFYRQVRRDSGILMDGGKPRGGKFSFDTENRLPWKGSPPLPEPLRFPDDAIKTEVVELVRSRYSDHPGTVDAGALPTTLEDAEALWQWAREECLPLFGPYEDAMTVHSRGLFHTRISPLLNLHRLLPGDIVTDVLDLDLPLASQEGFVRQLLGWREFVRHVHEAEPNVLAMGTFGVGEGDDDQAVHLGRCIHQQDE